MKNTTILMILDGYGLSSTKKGNAVYGANKPNLNEIFSKYPTVAIEASGEFVGLPKNQMGNSEVGHLTIGAGRIIKQGLALINESNLRTNNVLRELLAKKNTSKDSSTVHVVGLISEGGVHSHFNHMYEILTLLKESDIITKVHAITDGRDSYPRCAKKYLTKLEKFGIASISGRFYAMDRDKRWERTQKAFEVISLGNKVIESKDRKSFEHYDEVLNEHYLSSASDEFITPTFHKNHGGIEDGDTIIFTNFRADRSRQLAESISNPNFTHFERPKFTKDIESICMMSYSKELDKVMKTIFPKEDIKDTLGQWLESQNFTQLRLAETEKYAHVTFFFSGGQEAKFKGEERILIPSPKDVKTYDMKPQMSTPQITDKLIDAIQSKKYDFICVNYASADMVGHTGNYDAAVKAIECIDASIGKIMPHVFENDINLIITADHGNAECMISEDGTPRTTHTINKVPLAYVGSKKNLELQKLQGLADVAKLVKKVMS